MVHGVSVAPIPPPDLSHWVGWRSWDGAAGMTQLGWHLYIAQLVFSHVGFRTNRITDGWTSTSTGIYNNRQMM